MTLNKNIDLFHNSSQLQNKCHFGSLKMDDVKKCLFISISQSNTMASEEHFWKTVEKDFYIIPNFIKNAFK